MSLSGERWASNVFWSIKQIVRSPWEFNVGRRSVGELQVHRNDGGSVRYLPALLLDVEHCEGRRQKVGNAETPQPVWVISSKVLIISRLADYLYTAGDTRYVA